jgi:nucleoside-diphosphate-sugar epimerase
MSMRVLVTGDRGYIGAVMVPVLRKNGHEVVGLDAGWFEGCDFGPMTDTDATLARDIRDVTPDDLAGFDAVAHLAAISNDPIGHLNPQATYSVNAAGAVHVAAMAKEAGVPRFLFSSSCSLYGAAGDAPVAEDGAFNPVTPYGESKVLAERGISKLADDTFSPVYLRNATAYGSSPRLRADIVVNNLTGTAFTRGEVKLQSDGTPWRPLVHIEDISRAFLAALEAPREAIHDQAFNVGRDEDVVQIRDVALQVSEALNCPVTFAESAGPDKRDYRVDFTKIGQLLPAFKAEWTVAKGIAELAADMRSFGLTADDFEGPRFVRLARISELLASGRLDDELRMAAVQGVTR